MLPSFFTEFEKLSATVLMRKLSPVAKRFMDRMTGATRGAEIAAPTSARRLRHALTGPKAPGLMTELHGSQKTRKLLSPSELAAKQQSARHFQGVLQQQGKTYRGVPGMESKIQQIGGHSREITRTPARVVEQGTVASRPQAIRRSMGTANTQLQSLGHAPTVLAMR